jgi:hypothetical protein
MHQTELKVKSDSFVRELETMVNLAFSYLVSVDGRKNFENKISQQLSNTCL